MTQKPEPGCPKCGQARDARGEPYDGLCDGCGWDRDAEEYSR